MTITRSVRRKIAPLSFTVVMSVKAEDVESALISAFDCGSSYWIKEVQPFYNSHTVRKIIAGSLNMKVKDETGDSRILSRGAIHKGLGLMAKTQPSHFSDLVSATDADATTGDVLLQLCLFGTVVYG